MDPLTFIPSNMQFFLWSDRAGTPDPAPAALAARLREAGWPVTAHVADERGARDVAGHLVELIDALPVLASAGDAELKECSPSLSAWAYGAKLALARLSRKGFVPRLVSRYLGDGRTAGWEARWACGLASPLDRAAAAQIARGLGGARVVAIAGRFLRTAIVDASGRGLLRRMMDGCADMLVREAARRGSYVRLGGWPAESWEQRLVRALGDDRAAFAVRDLEPGPLARELRAFCEEQSRGPSLLGTLAAPPSWRAPETLEHVLGRLTEPAAALALHLLKGLPAPRTLVPAGALPVSRMNLNQAVAVTRALLHLTGGSAARKKASGQ